ncbi:cbb3-type cytochrome c oxidase subunit 3 [Pacificimonas sp. WHA3]|uniref:Cbb3-type cytochrome c oxidase subunit 3 n=1 Tax=Pacificimonas pallii TaxID=2827236 RepID=A0ABS6SG78_9SPHN|nr:cbb3-type cytochrome c oxidase subunit 3 [Pacificimonas pallii]MBV7257420.1 cbb3-type cytochrome c oxidase subunit 3 [Pacificimonas pallii]
MTYDEMRHFADSYGLVVMVILYIVLCGWAFRPNAKKRNEQAANMIFADDTIKDENDG